MNRSIAAINLFYYHCAKKNDFKMTIIQSRILFSLHVGPLSLLTLFNCNNKNVTNCYVTSDLMMVSPDNRNSKICQCTISFHCIAVVLNESTKRKYTLFCDYLHLVSIHIFIFFVVGSVDNGSGKTNPRSATFFGCILR